MPRTELRIALALLAGCALAVPARAPACTVNATGVGFGAYDPFGPSPDDGVGTISVTCHPNVHAPEVALEAGTSGQFATRTMVSVSARPFGSSTSTTSPGRRPMSATPTGERDDTHPAPAAPPAPAPTIR